MISLTSELKNLVYIFRILAESTRVLVLVFHIDFHFNGLSIDVNSFTLLVIDQALIYEVVKQVLRNVIVSHGVPSHLHLVEIVFLSEDVRHHTLIIHQVNLKGVPQINVCVLLPDHLQTSCSLGVRAWDHLLNVEFVGITD